MTLQKIVSLLSITCLLFTATNAHAKNQSFDDWLADVRSEASGLGISNETIDAALTTISHDDSVIELDRKQPEKTKRFEQYIRSALSSTRVQRASEEFAANRTTLESIGQKYGVPPEYIVALWGIESNFGDNMGNFNIVESLATLAYDGRRSDYFRKELLKSLQIIDTGHINADEMRGSWAGAMGQCQFMPSSFFAYAVDADGDGRKDIWNNQEDVFASIANYLSSVGWRDAVVSSIPVSITASTYKKLKHKKGSINQWKNWGVAPKNSVQSDISFALISGNHDGSGPYFLTSVNYDNILKWNRSRYFALAVGSLAESISKGAYK